MPNKIKKLTLLSAIFLFGFISLAPLQSLAAIDCSQSNLSTQQAIQCGSCQAAGAETCNPGTASGSLNTTITEIINLLSVAIGILAVVMIMIGGFRYITSGGNPESTKSARNTILYS
ncbi:pilin, partial [Candidatus Saccharibacteria bacterium]|nr:pilin [Candidatus Saccharibacteria bacterium]